MVSLAPANRLHTMRTRTVVRTEEDYFLELSTIKILPSSSEPEVLPPREKMLVALETWLPLEEFPVGNHCFDSNTCLTQSLSNYFTIASPYLFHDLTEVSFCLLDIQRLAAFSLLEIGKTDIQSCNLQTLA